MLRHSVLVPCWAVCFSSHIQHWSCVSISLLDKGIAICNPICTRGENWLCHPKVTQVQEKDAGALLCLPWGVTGELGWIWGLRVMWKGCASSQAGLGHLVHAAEVSCGIRCSASCAKVTGTKMKSVRTAIGSIQRRMLLWVSWVGGRLHPQKVPVVLCTCTLPGSEPLSIWKKKEETVVCRWCQDLPQLLSVPCKAGT